MLAEEQMASQGNEEAKEWLAADRKWLPQMKETLEQQKADAERRAQEEKNKARSTGSQSTAGKKAEMDAFDAMWYDGN